MLQFIKDNSGALMAIVVILALIYLNKKSIKEDRKRKDYNDYLHSKKEKEYFAGKNKPKDKNLFIDYKGKLIDMDEHWSGISEDKIN